MNTWTGRIPLPELTLDQVRCADGVIRLTAVGEIDVSTGDDWEEALHETLREPGVRRLLLDLTLLTFIDSNGVRVLIRAYQAAQKRGIRLGIGSAGGYIRNVLETLGVYALLATDDA